MNPEGSRMLKAQHLPLDWEASTGLEGFHQGSSHQIMGRRSEVRHQNPPPRPPALLPVSVQTSTLSGLSGPQTAEVRDPLPDLPIGFPEEFS